MTLIPCPACALPLSPKASRCPKCDHPLESSTSALQATPTSADAQHLRAAARAAMEDRRKIELRTFTAYLAFVLVTTNGLLTHSQQFREHHLLTAWTFGVALVVLLGLFTGFLITVELRNREDRHRYSHWADCLGSGQIVPLSGKSTETFCKTVSIAWAATFPWIASVTVSAAAILLVAIA